jgi:hypothetical protein
MQAKYLRGALSMIQVPFLRIARVVKWQTRTFEGRMPKGVGVQVPPRAGVIPLKVHALRYLLRSSQLV